MLKMLVEAAREHGAAATAANRQCTSRGGARKSEPRRGSWCSCGRCGVMERLVAALDRALHAQHAAHTHSPFVPAAWPT